MIQVRSGDVRVRSLVWIGVSRAAVARRVRVPRRCLCAVCVQLRADSVVGIRPGRRGVLHNAARGVRRRACWRSIAAGRWVGERSVRVHARAGCGHRGRCRVGGRGNRGNTGVAVIVSERRVSGGSSGVVRVVIGCVSVTGAVVGLAVMILIVGGPNTSLQRVINGEH